MNINTSRAPGKASIMESEALVWTLNTFKKINNWMKGFGIIGGAFLASIADWILGTITLTILFQNGQIPFPSWVIGVVWSGAAWGIQLLLWQLLLSGRVAEFFPNNADARKWTSVGLFLMIGLAKLADDVIDMMSIYWMAMNNPFQVVLDYRVYIGFMAAVGILSWVLVGFSEAFVSLAIFALDKETRVAARPGKSPDISAQPYPRPAPKPGIPTVNRSPMNQPLQRPVYHRPSEYSIRDQYEQ